MIASRQPQCRCGFQAALVFLENDMQLAHVMSCMQGQVLLVIAPSQAAVVIVIFPGSPA